MKTLYLGIITIVFLVFTTVIHTVFADDANSNQWHKYYLLGKYTGSDPQKPDKIFMFQYRTTNGDVKSFTGKNGAITANVYSPQNSLLEIKFPRNYPYTNTPTNWGSSAYPFLLINETNEVRDSWKSSDCFLTYSVPFSGETKVEIIWLYLLSQNPYRGDDVPQYCISETISSNSANNVESVIPEFPFAILILLTSFVSVIVFYKVRFRK